MNKLEKPEILPLTVAIPTYGRDKVLVDTIGMLLSQQPRASELLILDQSKSHDDATNEQLRRWHENGQIRWERLERPSQPGALNVGLQLANQPFVLFLDDDIRVESQFLQAHMDGFVDDAVWAVAGQVLQPGETPDLEYHHQKESGPFADCRFCFRSAKADYIENGMSGNLTVRKCRALQIGGFDENFLPPVAFRFDNDFCKRLCKAGGQIRFQPDAKIHHLRAARGGTRTNSNHLTSASPEHGIGDYYFALKHSSGVVRWRYVLRRFFREVRTRFHAAHPWWIPVKMVGELRAIMGAFQLLHQGPALIRTETEGDLYLGKADKN